MQLPPPKSSPSHTSHSSTALLAPVTTPPPPPPPTAWRRAGDLVHDTTRSFRDFSSAALSGLMEIPRTTGPYAHAITEASLDALLDHHDRIQHWGRTALGCSVVACTVGTMMYIAHEATRLGGPLGVRLASYQRGEEIPEDMAREATDAAHLAVVLTLSAISLLILFGRYGGPQTIGQQVAREFDEGNPHFGPA